MAGITDWKVVALLRLGPGTLDKVFTELLEPYESLLCGKLKPPLTSGMYTLDEIVSLSQTPFGSTYTKL